MRCMGIVPRLARQKAGLNVKQKSFDPRRPSVVRDTGTPSLLRRFCSVSRVVSEQASQCGV